MTPDPVFRIPEANEYAGTVNVYFISDLQLQHGPAPNKVSMLHSHPVKAQALVR